MASLGTIPFVDGKWTATVPFKEGRTITITVGDERAPDNALVRHAESIVADIESFDRLVSTYLAERAAADRHFADEIKALKIARVELWKPGLGQIFFSGPVAERAWRCDMNGGKLSYLGFD
jgi:hypothetical protein